MRSAHGCSPGWRSGANPNLFGVSPEALARRISAIPVDERFRRAFVQRGAACQPKSQGKDWHLPARVCPHRLLHQLMSPRLVTGARDADQWDVKVSSAGYPAEIEEARGMVRPEHVLLEDVVSKLAMLNIPHHPCVKE